MNYEMSEEQWKSVQEKTGTCILHIVMDVLAGRITAGQCMDKIEEHCVACYQEGATVTTVEKN